MLLLLTVTLVYLYHGSEIVKATPLISLTESVRTTTISSSLAGERICPGDQRSVWDILWSCLATIFACSWLSIHPNIPGPDEPWWRIFLRRLELMFWAVIDPEILIAFAFRQWLGARWLEERYKDRGWTKTHGYFIQMGGFMLFYGEDAQGVLSPEQFSELLDTKKIKFPTITVEEIEDRSKADGFSKTIALGQTLWFVAQCLARRAQHLDITLVELLTVSLAALNGLIYFLWWHKPLDVRCPVRVYLLDDPGECPGREMESENIDYTAYFICKFIFSKASSFISERWTRDTTIWQSLPILGKVLILIGWSIKIFALLALILPILPMVLVFLFLFPVLRSKSMIFNHVPNIGDMKVPTFYSFADTRFREEKPGLAMLFLTCITGAVFGGIHCAGWFFTFPSTDEAILWRVCSTVLTGIAFVLPLYMSLTHCWPSNSANIVIPLGVIASLGFIAYVLSKILLTAEAFISLRYLTPGMLALVKWTSFIPHI